MVDAKLSQEEYKTREIQEVRFHVLTSKEIIDMSTVEVKSAKDTGDNGVCSPWMGTCSRDVLCLSCGGDTMTCPGHFGHIKLAVPLLHPFFQKEVLKFMNVFCVFCHGMILTKQMLRISGKTSFDSVTEKCSKMEQCASCGKAKIKFFLLDNKVMGYYDEKSEAVPIGVEEIKDLFDAISPADLKFLKTQSPSRFILTALPVLPPQVIPFVKFGGSEYSDDLTTKYCTLEKTNNLLLGADKKGMTANKFESLVTSLEFHVNTLMDNSKGLAKHKNHRPIKAIGDRLGGKGGLMRGNLMGKRVDHTARTVAGPEMNIGIDEIAVPPEIASTLVVREVVCAWNKTRLERLMAMGKVNEITTGNGVKYNIEFLRKHSSGLSRLLYGDLILRESLVTKYSPLKKYQKLFFERLEEFQEQGGYSLQPRSEEDIILGRYILKKTMKIDPTNNPDFVLKPGDKILREGKEIEAPLGRFQMRELKIGDLVDRQLQDGDQVILNRQPTIQKYSMMAHKVRIIPGKTLRINLAICNPYNADNNIVCKR